MSWTIEQTIPTLAVPDLDAGIAFYERLGFELDWKWPHEKPTHAGLVLGSCSIVLSLCDPDERADVYFIVDDVSACHAAVLAGRSWELATEAGAASKRADCPPARALERPKAPNTAEYGLRDFSVVDPWGHHLSFGQTVQPTKALRRKKSTSVSPICSAVSPRDKSRLCSADQRNSPGGKREYPRVDSKGHILLFKFVPDFNNYFNALAHEMVHAFRFDRRWTADWFFEEGFAEFVALRADSSLAGFPWFGFAITLVAGQWVEKGQDIPLTTLRENHRTLNLSAERRVTRCEPGSLIGWGEHLGMR